MPITILKDAVVVGGRRVSFSDFPRWHSHHLAKVSGTRELEKQGAALVLSGFPCLQLPQFIRGICRWGGYAGIAGRILKRNATRKIREQFESARHALTTSHPVRCALAALNRLKGLGTPSFASKHLRFLRPDICPVLDRLLCQDLGYSFTAEGYQQISHNCCSVAKLLPPVPFAWGAADVEMSFFAFLQLPVEPNT